MKNLDFKIKKIAEIFDAKLIGNKEVKITWKIFPKKTK